MKLVQRYPLQFNGRATLELTDTSVIYTWVSLRGSARYENPFADISPVTSITRGGDRALPNYAWFFAVCAIAVSVLKTALGPTIELPLFTFFLLLAAIFGISYLVRKNEHEVFNHKGGGTLFGIKKTASGQEIVFTQVLKSKLT